MNLKVQPDHIYFNKYTGAIVKGINSRYLLCEEWKLLTPNTFPLFFEDKVYAGFMHTDFFHQSKEYNKKKYPELKFGFKGEKPDWSIDVKAHGRKQT